MIWEIVLVLMLAAIIFVPLLICLFTLAYPWFDQRRAKRRGNYNVEQRMSHIPAIMEEADSGFHQKHTEKRIELLSKVDEDKSQRYPKSSFVAIIPHGKHSCDDTKTKEGTFQFYSELTAPDCELHMNYFDDDEIQD
uniref:Uncharacterized protein n=1 Tax=Plectus sambesii TaxID=2011161 RepID=A0A914XA96_9BILA